ncbi:uncharacterized protein GGS22DRAFT_121054 [Annulohypoxylon maeteangense]|uniref:uncharacterized protein n=1 Tax=Annulohypoxylon maeteangense TaxID=1927788 RepID=UPI0020086A67|nr:uncharacterized protein GGS22DRAFT_121054 [Annulohypoxylon maeteangense]KAI0887068.1 hypothetical protein GGS22DRAFT_121054 [Annulohypoxylon maeteangense]
MMFKWFFLAEDYVVQLILRSPSFQRGVRRIHRTVQDYKHGRDPSEPLREGEATRDPTNSSGFLSHFIDELRNQARGTTTNSTSNRPKK